LSQSSPRLPGLPRSTPFAGGLDQQGKERVQLQERVLDLRKGHEVQSQDAFRGLIKETHRDRFEVIHWETLYDLSAFERRKLARLRCYLENKTLRLKQAFQLGRMWVNVRWTAAS
jgi:hypothetical protein